MAGYDPEQDKKIAEWKNEETGLIISIMQYGQGEPKLQVGPRIMKKKDGSDRAPMKAGSPWKMSCGCMTLLTR